MQRFLLISCLILASTVLSSVRAQNLPSPPAPTPAGEQAFTTAYPSQPAGILIRGTQWTPLANQNPTKTKTAHSFAAGLSYGMVPAKIVAEYAGEHAPTQVEAPQPVICVCHFFSIPGTPVLVRLHPKKGARELDGGRMTVYPLVGGAKIADANKSDLIAADVTQPESQVWLIRPQSPLEPGEYALLLGTQNISIFPFTVSPPVTAPAPAH